MAKIGLQCICFPVRKGFWFPEITSWFGTFHNGFVEFLCHKWHFTCTNVFSFNRGMFNKNTEACILETFQIRSFRSSKIKFGDIRPKFLIAKIFMVPIVYHFCWQFPEPILNSVMINKWKLKSLISKILLCWTQFGWSVKIKSMHVWNILASQGDSRG